jgi:flavin-dependent dehydrogenase
MNALASEWDAVVIGAGPAGALAARQLAQAGFHTLLVDKKRFPRAKVCGACLNGRALWALSTAGLSHVVQHHQALALRRLVVHAGQRHLQIPLPEGCALGREQFDAALVEEAQQCGVTFQDDTTATIVPVGQRSAVRLVNALRDRREQTLSARLVIAADGLQHSCLTSDASFRSEVAADSPIGLGTTIADHEYPLEEGDVQMAVGRDGYVGIVRLAGGRLNLAAAVSPICLRRQSAGAQAAAILRDAGVGVPQTLESAAWHGTVPLTRTTRRVADWGLLLLGDATGYVEPFSGEGIAWALCSALLAAPLAREFLIGELSADGLSARWSSVHAEHIRQRQRWCRRLAWLLKSPARIQWAGMLVRLMPQLAQAVVREINSPLVSVVVR